MGTFLKKLSIMWAILLVLVLPAIHAEEDGNLEVLLARPNTQNVSDVQQISVTFNKAMVPLGDYEKEAKEFAISITPKVDCQWRWLNSSTLACQLNQTLPPSNAYQIRVPAGIKALDGTVLKKETVENKKFKPPVRVGEPSKSA